MKPTKGLYRDSSLEEQPNGSIVGGKNLIYSSKYGELINEPGFSDIDFTPSGQVIGIIGTSMEYVVFQILDTPTNSKNSEIGIIKNSKYTRIFRANLDFNINFPIFGEVYFNFKGEMIVCFSDAHNTPKIVNLDDLPFNVSLTQSKDILDDNDISHIDMFASFKIPEYDLYEVNESNGNLPSGAIYVTIQYKLPDTGYGNFLHISNPIYIIESSSQEEFHLIGAGEAGIPTTKSISMLLRNLDNRYNQFRFGIIHKAAGSINAYLSGDKNISNTNSTYLISGITELEPTSLDTILVKSSYYSKIHAMTNIDNTLWTANLEEDPEIRYQKYANNIEVEYVYEDEVALNGFVGSHKDPVFLFDKKSFMPGEIYALYIRGVYKNGVRTTPAYHIPGRALTGEEKRRTIGNAAAITRYPRHYQFYDTCNSAGKLSGWENESEKYPNELDKADKDKEYNGTVDYDGFPIANGVNLSGRNIRHHKMPSLGYLANYIGFIKGSTGQSIERSLYNAALKKVEEWEKYLIFKSSSVPSDYMSNNNTVFTNVDSTPLVLGIKIQMLGYFTSSHYGTSAEATATFIINKTDGITNSYIYTTGVTDYNPVLNVNWEGVTTLQAGEYIEIINKIRTTGEGAGYKVDGHYAFDVIRLRSNNFNKPSDATLSANILGIKLKNIYIPDDLKEKCDYFEVLYAERNSSNMSVLAQGLFTPPRAESETITDFYSRFYGYDLLSTKKKFKATHIVHELDFNKPVFADATADMFETWSVYDNVFPVTQSRYILNNYMPAEVPWVGVYDRGNAYREEFIYLKTDDTELIDKANYNKLVSLVSFNPNPYEGFTNQKLIRTGKLIPIGGLLSKDSISTTPTIYGGDVHVNLHGVTQLYPYDAGATIAAGIRYSLYPCFSTLNIGYRYEGKSSNETFFPAFNFITNRFTVSENTNWLQGKVNSAVPESLWSRTRWQQLIDTFGYLEFYDMVEYYPELYDYNSPNNLEPPYIFDISQEFINKFPFRVHKSNSQLAENKSQNWRIFSPDEYYESSSNKGEIIQLATDGQDLLILHKYSLFVVQNIKQLNISENVVTSLGDANLFNTRPIEIVHDKAGYVGCQSKWAVISFKFGVLIIDRFKDKIFIYNNLTVQDISSFGLEEFFINNLQYDVGIDANYIYHYEDNEIIEFEDGTPVEYKEPSTEDLLAVDNPFTQVGYTAVWDEIHSRILITKVYNNDANMLNSSTMSYYPELKLWLCFHDYAPNFSISNREGVVHLKDNLLYKANNKTNRNYYFGTYKDVSIDIVFNQPVEYDKLYQSITWATKYYKNKVEQKTKTFNGIRILNNFRDSGNIVLDSNLSSESNNIRNIANEWRFNALRDILVKNTNIQTLELNTPDIITDEARTYTTNWFDNNLFIDKFIVVRLSVKLEYSAYIDYIKYVLGEGGYIEDYMILLKVLYPGLTQSEYDFVYNLYVNNDSIKFKILDISANYNIVTR